jgi:twitching motility protein PilT
LDLNDILKAAVKNSASDIHLKVGLPPIVRINGKLVPLKVPQPLRVEDLNAISDRILVSTEQKERFENNHEVDCSYSVPGLGRFRVNLFLQRSTIGITCRE